MNWLEKRRPSQSDDRSSQNDNAEVFVSTDPANFWIALASVVTAVATVITGGISYGALAVIRGQLDEMKSGSYDTHTAAEAASSNANTSKKAMLAAQRAWVGPMNATLSDVAEDKPITTEISYRNFGREPATSSIVQGYLKSDYFNAWQDTAFVARIAAQQKECMTRLSSGGAVTFPASNDFSGYKATAINSDDPDLSAHEIINKRQIAVVTGCITYKTQDKQAHTFFCYYYKQGISDKNALTICPYGNDAD